MTDGRPSSGECLDAETLAAFVDGRLRPHEREVVEAHLADCEECYEVWMESQSIAAAVDPRDRAPSRMAPLRWVIAASAAAAALVAAVFWLPTGVLRRDPVEIATGQLVSAVGAARFVEGRLSAPFVHGPAPSPVRGDGRTGASIPVKQAALVLQELADQDESAATLRGAGLGLLATGELDAAITALGEAAELGQGRSDVLTDLSAAFHERWRRDGAAGDAARALDAAQRALVLAPDSAEALFNSALACEAMALRDDAIRSWERYLQVDAVSAWATEARAHLARLQGGIGQADAPILERLSRGALVVWAHALGEARGAAAAEAARLAAAIDAGGGDRAWVDVVARLPKVSGTAEMCLADAIAAADRWWSVYNNGDYAQAATVASAITANLGCAGAPTAEGEWREAIIDIAAGRSPQALARADTLARIARERRYPAIGAISAHIRGLVAMQRSQYDHAVGLYETALEEARRAGDEELVGATYGYLITAHSAQGRRALAWEDARQCNLRLAAMSNMRRRYQCFSRGSQLAQETALAGYEAALGASLLEDAVAQRFPWTASIGHVMRARALDGLGQDMRALGALAAAREAAARITDPVFRRESEVEVSISEGRILARSDPGLAVARLTEALSFQQVRANRFRTASLLLERGRAHAVGRNTALAEADWESGITIFEDQSLSVRDQQLRITRTADAWDLFDELADSQRARPAHALATVERGRARELLDSLRIDQTVRAPQPVTTFTWLPQDVVVLVYATLRERTLVWAVTRRGLQSAEVTLSRRDVAKRVRTFLRTADASEGPDPLSAVLLPPGIDVAPTARIVIIPDGDLYSVPFGLLRHPQSGRRLVETGVISIAPSLAVLQALYAHPLPAGPRSALLVGVGDGVDGTARLAAVEREVRAAQSYYGSARSKVLLNHAASASEILESIGHFDVFSFSGHAIVDAIRPSNSHLVTGGAEARLLSRDLAGARLRPGMVVALAACETADGDFFRGEGVMSLARPFLAAGASSVLATLWAVPDREASRVVTTFHRLVSAGADPATALASAQRDEIQQGATHDWAAFVVIGR